MMMSSYYKKHIQNKHSQERFHAMKRSFIMNCMIIITCLMFFMLPDCSGTKTAQKQAGLDYLAIVRIYADIMIEHGRDVYGTEHTPLFAVALDRHTFSIPEG